MSNNPIKGTCHCGGITVIIPRKPTRINECQCSICRRYSAAWVYFQPKEIKFDKKPGHDTKKYIWGDKEIEFHFCDLCGCVVCWWPIENPDEAEEAGVNSRMMDPEDLKLVNREVCFNNNDR